MSSFIGIDLGTTFSAVAYIDDTGRPVIIRDARGSNLTPSVVAFDDQTALVGEPARQMWAENPTDALARFKRDMGTSKAYHLGDKEFSPPELSMLVLEHLRSIAESQIGSVGEAVVTVPANFSSEAREETLSAAKEANLNINYIIDEPTAAALYYAYAKHKELDGIYGVYDFGGGTFDVSIIRVSGKDVEVISSSGVAKLGGDDFDRAMQRLVSEKYRAEYDKELPIEAYTLDHAEADKKKLTDRSKIDAGPALNRVSVSRSEYEGAIKSLIGQAEMACEAALDEAGIEASEIEDVFLAGGSTRMPAIQKSVASVFGKEPLSLANVDEVVALGAAIYAAFKGDQSALSPAQKAAISTIESIDERVHEYYGTISIGFNEARSQDEQQNSILIRRGSKVPVEVTETFYTRQDNQRTVHCVVTSSLDDESDPRFVKKVWEGDLPLPPNRPAGQEIDVMFGYTANKTMTAKFIDVASGESVDIELHDPSGKNKKGIDRFKV